MTERKRRPDEAREQKDVLPGKDNVTRNRIGLQQWGEQEGGGEEHKQGLHGGKKGQYGNASVGTAERQARIGGLVDEDEPEEGQPQQ